MYEDLRERGYRLTPQRLMVVEAIHDANGHIGADEILASVRAKYQYANISTVYRTLELLKELGLVVEVDLGEGRIRYHAAEKGHHHHLVCRQCGSVARLDESGLAGLASSLRRDYGFEADLRHLAISGLCRECSGKQGQSPRTGNQSAARHAHSERDR